MLCKRRTAQAHRRTHRYDVNGCLVRWLTQHNGCVDVRQLGSPQMKMKNLLTDVAGVTVGHAQNDKVASGTTAILFDWPVVAAMDVRGGGPGVRDAVLLDLVNTVET